MKRNSAAMEKAGFKARIDELQNKGLNIEEVVTDAHLGIKESAISSLSHVINLNVVLKQFTNICLSLKK